MKNLDTKIREALVIACNDKKNLNKDGSINWNFVDYDLWMHPESEKFTEIELKDDDIEEVGTFLDLFCNTVELKEKPDFIILRSNPIHKKSDNSYIIINKLFLVERIFKSIIFEFSLDINKIVPKEHKLKDFRANYCDNFSEQKLLYKFIYNSFPNNSKYIKVDGNEFLNKKYIGEPDYYVRFKNKVLLFESKDVILKGDEKQSRNYLTLKEALQSKFLKI